MRFLLLVLACASVAHAQPTTPTNATALDSLIARVGTTIEPSEKVYFGLFPDIPLNEFNGATIKALPEGDVQVAMDLRRGGTERRLSPEMALLLARHVVYYEVMRAPSSPAWADRLSGDVRRSGLARLRTEAPTGPPLTIRTRRGDTVRGWVVHADSTYLTLYPADRPFDLWNLEEHAIALSAASIEYIAFSSPILAASLDYAEAATSLTIQAASAFLAYQTESDLGNAVYGGGMAVLAAGVSGGAWAVQERYGAERNAVRGERAAYIRALPQLREAAFLRTLVPLEFTRWHDTLPSADLEWQPFRERAIRPLLHVMISSPLQPAVSGSVRRNAVQTRRGTLVENDIFGSEPSIKSGRAGVDVTLNPIRFIHIGAEAYWNRAEEEQMLEERNTRSPLFLQYENLVLDDTWAVFAGVTLGDGTTRWVKSRLEIGGGVGYVGASVVGAFVASLATSSTLPFADDPGQRYSASESGYVPYGRIAYDFAVTPVTSFSVKLTYAQQPDIVLPEITADVSQGILRWTTTKPEHTYTFSPWSLSFGLRTHL